MPSNLLLYALPLAFIIPLFGCSSFSRGRPFVVHKDLVYKSVDGEDLKELSFDF